MAMTVTVENKGIKTTVFSGVERARIQGLTLQGGVEATLCFTVSCNADDKASGDFHQVTGLKVTFDNVLIQNLLAGAMARRVIQWAPTLRENPTRIKELDGKTVRFDEPLFPDLAKKSRTVTVARPPTDEEMAAFIARMSPVQKMELALKAMREDGADTTLVEAELEALKSVSQE